MLLPFACREYNHAILSKVVKRVIVCRKTKYKKQANKSGMDGVLQFEIAFSVVIIKQ